MADTPTSMDYGAVESMAAGFGVAADTLEAVRVALEATIAAINSNFFTGLLGAGATAYLVNIVNKMKPVIDMSHEFDRDLRDAVRRVRDGDTTGSTHFV